MSCLIVTDGDQNSVPLGLIKEIYQRVSTLPCFIVTHGDQNSVSLGLIKEIYERVGTLQYLTVARGHQNYSVPLGLIRKIYTLQC